MNLRIAVAAAILLPTLIGFTQAPASSLYGQLLSIAAWALLMGLIRPTQALPLPALLVPAALLLLMLGVISSAWGGNPEQGIESIALLLAAATLFCQGARGELPTLGEGVAWGCLLVGLCGALIGFVQVFTPAWTDGHWIAKTPFAGRAVGNIRQPNHLATWLLLAAVGLVWLAQLRNWPLKVTAALMTVLIAALVLTASRSGLWFGVPVLMLWGAADRRLQPRLRLLLMLTPLIAGLAWMGLHWWAASGHGSFGAEIRLEKEGAASPSRLSILRDSWALLMQQPWTGVGWGAFNRAWTLTPFPERSVHFFDHSHNLPLQLLVELGLPLGLLVIGLMVAAFFGAWRLVRAEPSGLAESPRRALFTMLLVLGLHSMLEYPLWYPYFLLPAALIAGLCFASAPAPQGPTSAKWPLQLPRVLGALLFAGTALAFFEYQKVASIYTPPKEELPLALRLDAGMRALFFSHYADHAAAITLSPSKQTLAAAERSGRQFIDAKLLIAWANGLIAIGEVDKARYLVARLREFRSREGEEWLQRCANQATAGDWMCRPPERSYSWRDF